MLHNELEDVFGEFTSASAGVLDVMKSLPADDKAEASQKFFPS